MWTSLRHSMRLFRTACILAQYDALIPHEIAAEVPRAIRWGVKILRLMPLSAGSGSKEIKHASAGKRLAAALSYLGPTYIKLGQFLATRPDIIGADLADDLKSLQDRLPPFAMDEAKAVIEKDLGASCNDLFSVFEPPMAAASIAQVHRARLRTPDGSGKDVAVKVLRPGSERIFQSEMDTFAWAAGKIERVFPESRRLEPKKLIATLQKSVELEMDLRLEAAAASEMAERNRERARFRVPNIVWPHTSQKVLTTEWIDGTPLGHREALLAAGHDLDGLAQDVVQLFLHHALDDGFFHADMHHGNLFVDAEGRLVAVDFGIMGRLDKFTRRYLAEILYGFITRDYERLADIHFDAGYVSRSQSRAAFAQALRSVGEPVFDRKASDISMARLLAQLFQVTDMFDMHLQPQLVLLQKTMVVVEGVARDLNPSMNIWDISRPIVEQWMHKNLGAEAKVRDLIEGVQSLAPVIQKLPELAGHLDALSAIIDEDGLRLHPDTLRAMAAEDKKRNASLIRAVWVAAFALAALAIAVIFS